MHRKNKNELYIINPLNLEDNNEDIVKCTKIMINLSDSDELKILGNQIIDSTVLKKILDENKVIKKHVSSYNDLYEQLALTSNKYSKFEKILRNNSILTKAFISDKYLFKTDINNYPFNKKIELDKIYLNISSKSYPLSVYFDLTNALKKILLNSYNNDFANSKNRYCIDKRIEKIIQKKEIMVAKVIAKDSSIDNKKIAQYELLNNLLKVLLSLDRNIFNITKLLDNINSRLFVLDPKAVNYYIIFKQECELLLFNSIQEKEKMIENIENKILNMEDIPQYDKIRKKEFKNYIFNKISNKKYKNQSYINYIKNNTNNKKFVEYELKKNDEYLSYYSSYLIYKSSIEDKRDLLSFDEFLAKNYNNKSIDTVYKIIS